MAMTFVACVNRILQINGFIRGDTDTLTNFTDTQHASSSAIAQIAVQREINELTSRGLIPSQHKINATLTMATGTRSYNLAADFIQIWGARPFFYDPVANFQIAEYPGGEEQLRDYIFTYRTDPGYPLYWYFELGTGQQVSFYPVPDAPRNGLVLYYDYEASVQVSASTDNIPFFNTDQQYAFTDMAARRFKYIFEGKPDVAMEQDEVYREARSRLFSLTKWKQPPRAYGRVYSSGVEVWEF